MTFIETLRAQNCGAPASDDVLAEELREMCENMWPSHTLSEKAMPEKLHDSVRWTQHGRMIVSLIQTIEN
jgi:hypothetical protein